MSKGKIDTNTITALEKQRDKLTSETKFLHDQRRRLLEEIATVESQKKKMGNNGKLILAITRDLDGLQKNIKDELGKLSKKTREIRGHLPQSSLETPSQVSNGPPAPPKGPPPPPKAPPALKKTTIKVPASKVKATENKAQESPKLHVSAETLKNVALKSPEPSVHKTGEQLKEEAIQPYQLSIQRKEEEKNQLISKIGDLATQLETAKASQEKYEETLPAQKEAIEKLNKRKSELEGAFTVVKGKVESELSKIKEAEDKRIQLEEAKKAQQQRALDQTNTASGVKSNVPPPPPSSFKGPPPPPPPAGKGPLKKGTNTSGSPPVQSKKKSVQGGPALDTGELQKQAIAGQKRQEEKAYEDHLIQKLSNLTLKTVERAVLDPNEQQLLNLVETKGLEELKKSIKEAIQNLPKNTMSEDQIKMLKRRDQMEGEPILSTSEQIRKHKDHPNIKAVVMNFFREEPRKSSLLAASKDIKNREDAEAKRLDAEKKAKAEKERIAKAEADAIKQQQLNKERAIKAQAELKQMGVKEGIVNLDGVEIAQSDKEQALLQVAEKEKDLKSTDDFIFSVSAELEKQVKELLEAETNLEVFLDGRPVSPIEITSGPKQESMDIPVKESLQKAVTQPLKTEEVVKPINESPRSVVENPSITTSNDTVTKVAVSRTDDREKRKALFVEFDAKLQQLINLAVDTNYKGFTKVSKEVYQLCTGLINAKDKYIEFGEKQTFINDYKAAVDPKNLKELAKYTQNKYKEGVMDSIIRIIQSIIVAISSNIETKSNQMIKKFTEMKEGLNKIKENSKTQEDIEEKQTHSTPSPNNL